MKLLVTGSGQWTEEQLNTIRSYGHTVFFQQMESDELSCPYEQVEGIVCNGLFLHHDIKKFSNLSFVQLTSAGYDRVPLSYIHEKQIAIYNARGVYSIPMAEFALCGILQLYKQSQFFYNNQKEYKWNKNRSLLELSGKTACILGCGSVGGECAKRLAAFGVTVNGVDITPFDSPYFEKMVGLDELDNLLPESDIVILCLPLTAETEHFFNRERFGYMKQGSVLINIARGKIVDTDALLSALQTTLRGAVLDVFEEEPLCETSPLWDRENVILTPHNSFVSEQNNQRLFDILCRNLKNHEEKI